MFNIVLENKLNGNARNDQILGFVKTFKTAYENLAPVDDEECQKYCTQVITYGDAVQLSYEIILSKSETARIDEEVDDLYVSLGHALGALKYVPDPELNQKGRDLHDIWSVTGFAAARLDIDTEINMYDKLNNTMLLPENQEKMELFTTVKMIFDAFSLKLEELKSKRESTRTKLAEQRSSLNVSEARDELFSYVNGPFWIFLSYKCMEEPEIYNPFARAIQAKINEINELVKRRKTISFNEEIEQEDGVR